jgi:hypothetical protein
MLVYLHPSVALQNFLQQCISVCSGFLACIAATVMSLDLGSAIAAAELRLATPVAACQRRAGHMSQSEDAAYREHSTPHHRHGDALRESV